MEPRLGEESLGNRGAGAIFEAANTAGPNWGRRRNAAMPEKLKT
jgi:hypothetical protein